MGSIKLLYFTLDLMMRNLSAFAEDHSRKPIDECDGRILRSSRSEGGCFGGFRRGNEGYHGRKLVEASLLFVILFWSGVALASDRLDKVQTYLVYYGGDWSDRQINKALEFDLVIVHPGDQGDNINPKLVSRLKAGKDKKPGTTDDIIVLAYITIGEDDLIERGPRQVTEETMGPAYRTKDGKIKYSANGFRNWYLDQTAYVLSKDGNKIWGDDGLPKITEGHDKLPDENGKWGSFYAYVKDGEWQRRIKRKMVKSLVINGCDGLFLDTVDTASPWAPYGWTQKDMVDLIVKIRSWFQNKVLVMNRGLFLFEKYGETLANTVDAVMFESYVSEWNWHDSIGYPHRWYQSNQTILHEHLAPLNKRKGGLFIFFLNYFDPNQPEAPLFHHELAESTAGYKAAYYVTSPDLQSIKSPTLLPRYSAKKAVKLAVLKDGRVDLKELIRDKPVKKSVLFVSARDKNSLYPSKPFEWPMIISTKAKSVDLSYLSPGDYEVNVDYLAQDGAVIKQGVADLKIKESNRPGKVKGLHVKVRDKSLTLKWQKVLGVNSYEIRWGTDRFRLSKKVTVRRKTSYKFLRLKNETTYYFQVIAVKGAVMGYPSDVVFETPADTTRPNPPKLAEARVSGVSVYVKWDKSDSLDVAGYMIYLDPVELTRGLPIKTWKHETARKIKVPKPGRYKLHLSSFDLRNNESKLTETKIITVK